MKTVKRTIYKNAIIRLDGGRHVTRVRARRVILSNLPDRIFFVNKKETKYTEIRIIDAYSGMIVASEDSSTPVIESLVERANDRVKNWVPKGLTFASFVDKELSKMGYLPFSTNVKTFSQAKPIN